MRRSRVVLVALTACSGDAHGPDAGADIGGPCIASPAGTEARWRGEGDTSDDTGRYDGVASGVTFVAGRAGQAFAFDGVDDHVSADPTDQLWPAASFSVEAWVKTTTSATTNVTVIGKYDCGGMGAGSCTRSDWRLVITPVGHPLFSLRVPGGTGSRDVTAQTAIDDGAWHHLVAVRIVDERLQQVYVDGELAVSMMLDTSDVAALRDEDGLSDPVTIGGSRAVSSDAIVELFPGAIDDVAVYSRALSAGEIAELYAASGVCP